MAKRANGAVGQELFTMDTSTALTRDFETDFDFLRPLKPTIVFTSYWRFAVERQEVYHRRVRGEPAPWSNDPVMRANKFTNAYRAADRVSQYLIRRVIGEDKESAENTFFRILLFKLFNKIDTWELLVSKFGQPCVEHFRIDSYCDVLNQAFARGERLYSAAYIMPSGGRTGFPRKHQMHLHLLKQMLLDELPSRMAEAGTMERAFALLRSCPTLGDFLAYQFVTDLNYSQLTNFDESEFVVPGPGAKGGLQKCFSSLGNLSEADVIRLVTDRQEECLRALRLRFPTLWGRPLQLIDCQNLFCEVNKYARVVHPDFSENAGRTRIKQKLRPAGRLAPPMFPAKWGLNDLLQQTPSYVPGY
jgi:alpha-glutamyl/putrescinyl thymine pyrophosphorylase clade 1